MTLNSPKSTHAITLFVVLAASLCSLCTLSARAQLVGKGAIRGTVADTTGAHVPNATIVATNIATGVKGTTKTTGAGDYQISLDPGAYTVTVTAPGFRNATQENIRLDALATVSVNVALQAGAANETVVVTAAPPALETSNATLGATMEQEMYAALPIQMGAGGFADQRRATDFINLMPGVQNNETSNNETDNTGPNQWFRQQGRRSIGLYQWRSLYQCGRPRGQPLRLDGDFR